MFIVRRMPTVRCVRLKLTATGPTDETAACPFSGGIVTRMKSFEVAVLPAMLLTLAACGQRSVIDRDSTSPGPATAGESALTDVELQCRAKESLAIGRLNADYGPTCDKPTMPAALNLFDLGSGIGEYHAAQFRLASTTLCLCGTDVCDEKTRLRTMDDAAHLDERRDHDSNEQVNKIMNSHASHSCLNGTIAVELYQAGFTCGYLVGMNSSALRAKMESLFVSAFPDDRRKAMQLAQGCWEGPSRGQ